MVYVDPLMAEAAMQVRDLKGSDFSAFFHALWQKKPFAWQTALAKQVLGETEPAGWPEAIALPTAAGKTACLDIAVFALAAQANRLAQGQLVYAPRRIFLVVDRRIIVDEAHDRARQMVRKLSDAKDGPLALVAHNLRLVAGHDQRPDHEGQPLEAHILRGGIYRSEAWGRNPLQPSIIASTVDQIGSRLLFRAYGRRQGVWPIYAGLTANDSLILLDEAHCAQPFLQTLRAVAKYREWGHAPLGRPFHPVVMSATPPPDMREFRDESDEGKDPRHPLGKRQMALKPATLDLVESATKAKATEITSKAITEQALKLADGGPRAIVAFVNRVATARRVREILAKGKENDCELLTGRMRAIDKDAFQERLQCLHSSHSQNRRLEKSLIVVATQTLEVGADFDFDGLVTECASLDALRQRFGRLNRIGRTIEAKAVIVARGDQAEVENHDPVYGCALAETWKWLEEHKNKHGSVDFGIASMDEMLLDEKNLNVLNAPSRNATVMLPAHVNCWAQTSPEPQPTPDVSLFLHGRRENAADVHICWRADIDLANDPGLPDDQEPHLEMLRLCPPGSAETLPVPIGVFKRWLEGSSQEDGSADVQGDDAEYGTSRKDNAKRRVVRWRGREEVDVIRGDPGEIRPGDVIVIPFGHFTEALSLGDVPQEVGNGYAYAGLDVGDWVYLRTRAKAVLRLHPRLVQAWPECFEPMRGNILELLENLETEYEQDPDETLEGLGETLENIGRSKDKIEGDIPTRWKWLPEVADALTREYGAGNRLGRACQVYGETLILVGHRIVSKYAGEADKFGDEDDAGSSGISHRGGKPVLLRKHLPGVENFARQHAEGAGLSTELIEAIARAGLFHDLGKADPRFQSMLRGGTPWDGEFWAKSARYPKSHAARHRAQRESGYPKGARHELLSVRMAENASDQLPKDRNLRDLVLHLVASHHGRCRPFAPVVDDDDHPEAKFEELPGYDTCWAGGPLGLERFDSGISERYWRLTRQYGWWGLAWLEALLRLADWRRSEWEENSDGG